LRFTWIELTFFTPGPKHHLTVNVRKYFMAASLTKPRGQWPLSLDRLETARKFGMELGRRIQSPGLIAFFGELGSGKTTLIQAIGAGVGVSGPITSPTYTFVNRYEGGRLPLVHVDCYRIEDAEQFYGTGLDEWLCRPGLVCMEWSEHASSLLPERRMELRLAYRAREKRSLRVLLFADLWPELDLWLDGWKEKAG